MANSWARLTSLKEVTILRNIPVLNVVLALYYFYIQASNKIASLASSTREENPTAAVAVDVTFSKTTEHGDTEHNSETVCAHGSASFLFMHICRGLRPGNNPFCVFINHV